jgi:hypothetical protein
LLLLVMKWVLFVVAVYLSGNCRLLEESGNEDCVRRSGAPRRLRSETCRVCLREAEKASCGVSRPTCHELLTPPLARHMEQGMPCRKV